MSAEHGPTEYDLDASAFSNISFGIFHRSEFPFPTDGEIFLKIHDPRDELGGETGVILYEEGEFIGVADPNNDRVTSRDLKELGIKPIAGDGRFIGSADMLQQLVNRSESRK